MAWLLIAVGADLTAENWLVLGDHLFSLEEAPVVTIRVTALLLASLALLIGRAKTKVRAGELGWDGFGFACKFTVPLSVALGFVMSRFIRNPADPEVQMFIVYSVIISTVLLLPLLAGIGMLEWRVLIGRTPS